MSKENDVSEPSNQILMNHNVIRHKTTLRKTNNQKKKNNNSGTVKQAKNHFRDGDDRWNKRPQIVFESIEQRGHKQNDTVT